ncbi:MAG: hypothetical protein IMF09_10305 [Proteobacteria bacterium]|nr:hypothetical protein [Pseudomonadota bacterium]
MEKIEFEKLIQKSFDQNFCCMAEDASRRLEDQLDRIEARQIRWENFVSKELAPFLRELKRK